MSRPSSRASFVSEAPSSIPGSRVRVAVRVRPPLDRAGAPEGIICGDDGHTLMLDLDGSAGADAGNAAASWAVRGPRVRSFNFDSVHDRPTTQAELFDGCGMCEMLDAALDGYTSTVFAYGQTGSGKTYTVSGPTATRAASSASAMPGDADPLPASAGLMQRAAHYLYEAIGRRSGVQHTVRATYLEIYNEQVVDLIEPGAPLSVRGSVNGGFYVEDLSVVQCRGLRDLQYVIAKGLEHRSRGVHQMNSDSSRSHAIFSVYIDALEDDDGTGRPAPARYGKISLLDLAGSENVRSTQSHGTGLKEAGSINKSLFALGQVIKALALEARNGPESRQPSGLARVPAHVPYRDSTLTKLLADSLGGSAHTLMIACCSPFLAYADESIRTLHYACSAGAIRNKPVIKLDPQEQLILRLRDEVATLKAKVAQLQGELERSNTRLIAHGLPTVAVTPATAGGAGGERSHSSGGERPRPPSAPPSACYSPDSARRSHGNGSVSIASFGNGYEHGYEGGREWAQWAPVPAPAPAPSQPPRPASAPPAPLPAPPPSSQQQQPLSDERSGAPWYYQSTAALHREVRGLRTEASRYRQQYHLERMARAAPSAALNSGAPAPSIYDAPAFRLPAYALLPPAPPPVPSPPAPSWASGGHAAAVAAALPTPREYDAQVAAAATSAAASAAAAAAAEARMDVHRALHWAASSPPSAPGRAPGTAPVPAEPRTVTISLGSLLGDGTTAGTLMSPPPGAPVGGGVAPRPQPALVHELSAAYDAPAPYRDPATLAEEAAEFGASPPRGNRSQREVALERQLRALASFSATDVIATQHRSGGGSWYSSLSAAGGAVGAEKQRAAPSPSESSKAAERTVCVSLGLGHSPPTAPAPAGCHSTASTSPLVPLVAIENGSGGLLQPSPPSAPNSQSSRPLQNGGLLQPSPPVARGFITMTGSTDVNDSTTAGVSRSQSTSRLASAVTSAVYPAPASFEAAQLHRPPQAQQPDGAVSDALADYKNKAKALRAKEFSLERSLRALSKYSAYSGASGAPAAITPSFHVSL